MKTIKKGTRGEDVKQLQKLLHCAVDGIFGDITEEAVKSFQKSKGLTPDGIVGAKTWAALGVTGNPRVINEIIIHCSATPEGKDFTVADIDRWHRQRGFNSIGYHWVIYRNGMRAKGRDESIIGAHCTGHNSHSIGVCYIGGIAGDGKTPKDTRTNEQKTALRSILVELRHRYPNAKIHSHRDYAKKACPSFDATTEYRAL